MTTLLVNNIHTLGTMDPTRREIPNGAFFIRDRIIEQVGTTAELPQTADKTLCLQGCHIVLLCQHPPSLLSNSNQSHPRRPEQPLFGWIKTLFPIWANLYPQ
jgi:8-oxoguanine deaminase